MTHTRLKVTQQVGNDPGLVLEPTHEWCSSGCYPKLTSLTTTPSKLNIFQYSTPTYLTQMWSKTVNKVPEGAVWGMGRAEVCSEAQGSLTKKPFPGPKNWVASQTGLPAFVLLVRMGTLVGLMLIGWQVLLPHDAEKIECISLPISFIVWPRLETNFSMSNPVLISRCKIK